MELFNSFRACALASILTACGLEHPNARGSTDARTDILLSDTPQPDVTEPVDTTPKDVFVEMDGGTDAAGDTNTDDGPVIKDGGPVDVFMDAVDVSPPPDTAVPMDTSPEVPAPRDVPPELPPPTDTMPPTDVSRDAGSTTRPGTPHFLLRFDESSGLVLSSDPARTFGELAGGASRTTASRFGTTGNGVSFQNPGDAVRATNPSFGNFGIGDFGLAAWFRLRSGAMSTRTLFSKRSVFALRIDTTGNLLFGSLDCTFRSTGMVSDAALHHFAIIRQSGMMRIVIDGVLVSAESACMGNFTGANNLYIGCSETSGTSPCNLPLIGDVDQAYAWTGSDTTLAGVRRLICADQREARVAPSSFCL